MKAKILALAAIAAFSTGTLATSFGHLSRMDDAEISQPGAISNDIYVKGFGLAAGWIEFQSQSGATVESDQQAQDNAIGAGLNSAIGGNAALFGAQGNIGVNLAAGAGNGQTNQAALATIDAHAVFASAQVLSRQDTTGNTTTLAGIFTGNHAAMGDAMLQGATGNVGVNIAAGAGNLQGNGLAASVNTGGTGRGPVGVAARAAAISEQSTAGNGLPDCGCVPVNNAVMNGFSLAGARGNIGINIGAGVGNAQSNGLAISNSAR
ncbi:hypothetical protein K6V92_24010 [Cupriavidus respiraculi]|uniref:hypothetical protein n=1 Tax=Cupriavidus respiraculi TaxID=195930 RepID=UPI001C983836|nr:hypothetical protein [Cupriavidus respiraculi]MBY4949676.1 hypothetical protein [Cupriavidus respiraculi]